MILTTSLYEMNQKILTTKIISKIAVDPNFTFSSYDYVPLHCFMHYCVKLILVDKKLWGNCSNFALTWFLLNSFGEMCSFINSGSMSLRCHFEISFWNIQRLSVIRRRSDYIIGFITPAIGPNKFKKLTRPIVPTHNLRGKVWMEDSTHGFTDN